MHLCEKQDVAYPMGVKGRARELVLALDVPSALSPLLTIAAAAAAEGAAADGVRTGLAAADPEAAAAEGCVA